MKKLYSQTKKFAAANKRFAKLSPAEKRVAIAKDVIAALDLRRFRATPGTYLGITEDDKPVGQVCDVTAGKRCNVCALGAVFVTTVEKFDALKVNPETAYFYPADFDKPGTFEMVGCNMRKYLEQFFSHDQLRAIENAFERTKIGDPYLGIDGDVQFCEGVTSPTSRMRRIMRNIIKNGGEFNPLG